MSEPAFTWEQEVPSMHIKATLSALNGQVEEPITLSLQVKHPAGCTLHLDAELTPFFLSSFRFQREEVVEMSSGETLLRYKLYPLLAGEKKNALADLMCMPSKEGDEALIPIRMQLEVPALHIIDMVDAALEPPLPLEPLPIALQGEALMLKDLHTPIQIPSWQHNLEVIHQHGVPWGGLALLITGVALFAAAFSWIKSWYGTREKKSLPPRDAAEEALLQLDNLQQRKLVEKGAFRAYYSSLIATLRWYLNKRFPVPLGGPALIPQEVQQLQEDLIAYADPVKFGRQPSTARDCELAFAYVKHCVYLVEKQRAENENSKKGE